MVNNICLIYIFLSIVLYYMLLMYRIIIKLYLDLPNMIHHDYDPHSFVLEIELGS